MFRSSIGWFICIFVTAVIATDYNDPDTTTEFDPEVTDYPLSFEHPGTEGAVQGQSSADSATECGQQVFAQLSVETAVAAAVLAVRHSCDSLRQAAMAYIRANIFQVLDTQGWADATLNHAEDLIQVIRLLAEPSAGTSAPDTGGSWDTPTTQADEGESDDSSTPFADTPTVTVSPTPPTDSAIVSDMSVPANAESGIAPTSQLPTDRSPAATSGAPPMASCPTPPTDEAAISRLRSLSVEEKGRRLIQAAKEGAVRELQLLLAAGANLEARGEWSETALHWAAIRRHAQAVSCLIGAGLDVGVRERGGETPLHWAAVGGDVETVKYLLTAGAMVDARAKWEFTPLHMAALTGHAAVVRLLVAASADINARSVGGWTPLHWAVDKSHPDVVIALLDAGADQGIQDTAYRTPLFLATSSNDKQLIDILRAHI